MYVCVCMGPVYRGLLGCRDDQSRSYLQQVYSFQNNEITTNYINSNSVIVKRQLVDAALRLDEILKEIFK